MLNTDKYLKNVSTLRIANIGNCTGCGTCVEVCPRNVFEIRSKKVQILDRDACMECGACKINCEAGVIEVNAGVGCAYAIISGMINKTEPTCGCSAGKSEKSSCCG